MKKHIIDTSAMIIPPEDKEWGSKIVFNQDALNLKNSLNGGYAQHFPPVVKTFDEKIAVFNYLKLKDKEQLKVLDIGTGCGHFITMLKFLGHDCQGTEIKESLQFLESLYNHYEIDVFELEVKSQTSFILPRKYDLITALRTVFNDIGSWTTDDWVFFKENLFEYLEPNGEIFIKTNIKSIPTLFNNLDKAFGSSLKGWNSLTFHIKKS